MGTTGVTDSGLVSRSKSSHNFYLLYNLYVAFLQNKVKYLKSYFVTTLGAMGKWVVHETRGKGIEISKAPV